MMAKRKRDEDEDEAVARSARDSTRGYCCGMPLRIAHCPHCPHCPRTQNPGHPASGSSKGRTGRSVRALYSPVLSWRRHHDRARASCARSRSFNCNCVKAQYAVGRRICCARPTSERSAFRDYSAPHPQFKMAPQPYPYSRSPVLFGLVRFGWVRPRNHPSMHARPSDYFVIRSPRQPSGRPNCLVLALSRSMLDQHLLPSRRARRTCIPWCLSGHHRPDGHGRDVTRPRF